LLQFDFRKRESKLPVVITTASDLSSGDVTASTKNGQHLQQPTTLINQRNRGRQGLSPRKVLQSNNNVVKDSAQRTAVQQHRPRTSKRNGTTAQQNGKQEIN
jgi:hypothetical protein